MYVYTYIHKKRRLIFYKNKLNIGSWEFYSFSFDLCFHSINIECLNGLLFVFLLLYVCFVFTDNVYLYFVTVILLILFHIVVCACGKTIGAIYVSIGYRPIQKVNYKIHFESTWNGDDCTYQDKLFSKGTCRCADRKGCTNHIPTTFGDKLLRPQGKTLNQRFYSKTPKAMYEDSAPIDCKDKLVKGYLQIKFKLRLLTKIGEGRRILLDVWIGLHNIAIGIHVDIQVG